MKYRRMSLGFFLDSLEKKFSEETVEEFKKTHDKEKSQTFVEWLNKISRISKKRNKESFAGLATAMSE